ncbi:MAG: phytanoyl-CoA dioxygenase family protein [Bacteroidia bacterium]|nr:phytanoyl-CoA dioxygenase family protein [Bacteroidia bacterium]
MSPYRQFLYNQTREKQLLEDGFFVHENLLSAADIQACLTAYQTSDQGQQDDLYNTLNVDGYEHRLQVRDSLWSVLGPRIKPEFIDYDVLGINFAIKKPGPETQFPLHVDDIHLDRSRHVAVNIWIPLVDVNEENGALYVVPRSHLLPQPIGGLGTPFPWPHFADIIHRKKISMNLKAGDALFFHDSIIHGSPHNSTLIPRPAIISAMLPVEAQPICYMIHDQLEPGKIELFEAPPDFFLKVAIGKRPDFTSSLGIFDFEPSQLSEAEFLAVLEGERVLK